MKSRSDVKGEEGVATICALAITIGPFYYCFRLKSYDRQPSPCLEDGDVMPDTHKARRAVHRRNLSTRGAASLSGSGANVTWQPGTNPPRRDFQMVARACVEAPRSPASLAHGLGGLIPVGAARSRS
jgi:hypothetical protein